MGLNITVLAGAQLRNGATPRLPVLDDGVTAQVVTLGLAGVSTAIAGPCVVSLVPDEDQRIAASKSAVYAAPPATGIKLKAGVERQFELPRGTWYINAAAG